MRPPVVACMFVLASLPWVAVNPVHAQISAATLSQANKDLQAGESIAAEICACTGFTATHGRPRTNMHTTTGGRMDAFFDRYALLQGLPVGCADGDHVAVCKPGKNGHLGQVWGSDRDRNAHQFAALDLECEVFPVLFVRASRGMLRVSGWLEVVTVKVTLVSGKSPSDDPSKSISTSPTLRVV